MSAVCITGATSGIGKAAAARFIKEGWQVVGTGRREERLHALKRNLGDRFLPLPLDVRDNKAVVSAFASLPPAFTPLDALINCAGLALGREPAWEASLEDWDAMVATNINGLYYCTHAVLGEMAARGKGHIINVGSISGNYAYPGGNIYGATKAFVKMFSKNLRCDLHGTGVRVTNIEPGMLNSEFSTVRFKGDAEKAAALYREVDPLAPDDVADILYYVATAPPHVNICCVEVMPTCQSNGGTRIAKRR
ncbi:MAG: SDR family NAD(P)-dependent oxidoreductase [Desulfovibrio sp.]|jgi:NADP-dependent 3-hydroxy acid dehydrogenase YdfG|nr:SDR family NAD(P)-dependent oxidoreductase [Desulfovibrio sp.]